jgi:hypothetical protein
MKLELTLLELNDLYYAVSKGVEKHTELVEIASRTTPELDKYFTKELDKSIQLLHKIQTALYDEANRIDDVINEVKTERDYSAFKDYADSMNEAQSEDRALGNI